MNLDLRYYLSICWRRMPLFLPIAGLISVLAFFVAISLPPKYESAATLLLESPQISDALAQSTVSVAPSEQMQIVQQRLMTRTNLLDIARQFEVYKDINQMTADEIIRNMNRDTRIGVSSGRNQATLMVLTFTSDRALTSAAVMNDYVTRILNDNTQFRKSRAEGTLEFFEQEVERLSRDLDQQSGRIMDFQSSNSEALPSTLGYRLSRQGQLMERLSLAERERISLTDQKRRIVQLVELTGNSGAAAPALTPAAKELAALTRDLNQALLIYSEENPKVKILRSRMEALEAEVAAELGATDGVTQQESLVELQLEEIDQRIANIEAQAVETQAEIADLQETIDRTPENEIALEALQREYEIMQQQYNAAVARLSAAATGERIEVLSKGERISVVDQPSIPEEPTSPNRVLIAGGGSVAGIMLAAGLIVLLELMNNSIRRPVDLTNRFGITPIGVLPVIRTPGDRMIKGTVMLATVAVVVVGVPAVLFAVHTYYLPLDLIAERALQKLGI